MSKQDTAVISSKSTSQQESHFVAALGRPFQLGMLYDCRNDTLVTGLSLWDQDTIKTNTRSSPKEWSNVTVTAKDDLDSKTFHIGANASITLSVLSGMVSVSGSANFLYDTKDSAETERISLKYSTTSRFEQLHVSNKLKENICDNVVDQKMATHVVTGILYGADAFFVFDRKKKEDSSLIDVSGSLKAAIKGIPKVAIEGSISGGLKLDEKKIADEVNCTFYGDITLDPLPMTYMEALRSYQQLPSLIGAGRKEDRTVPMKVWLLPLSALISTIPSYVRHLSNALSDRALHVIEEFQLLKVEACDLKKRISDFPFLNFIVTRLEGYISAIEVHRINFASKLGELLPKLRGDSSKGDSELEELLDKMTQSPFDAEGLRNQFDAIEREATTLNELFSLVHSDQTDAKTDRPQTLMDEYETPPIAASSEPQTDADADAKPKIKLAIKPGDFNNILLSTETHLLVLEIVATTSSDYLQRMMHVNLNENNNSKSNGAVKEWYDRPEVVAALRDRAQSFLAFAQEKENSSSPVTCVITCRKMKYTDSSNRVNIKLFTNGIMAKEFHLPSRPRNLEVKLEGAADGLCCELKWQEPFTAELDNEQEKPKRDSVTEYIVEYRGYTIQDYVERSTIGELPRKQMVEFEYMTKTLDPLKPEFASGTVTTTIDGLEKGLYIYDFTVRAKCMLGLCQKTRVLRQKPIAPEVQVPAHTKVHVPGYYKTMEIKKAMYSQTGMAEEERYYDTFLPWQQTSFPWEQSHRPLLLDPREQSDKPIKIRNRVRLNPQNQAGNLEPILLDPWKLLETDT